MAVTVDMVRSFYGSPVMSEAECAVVPREEQERQIAKKWGFPEPGAIGLPQTALGVAQEPTPIQPRRVQPPSEIEMPPPPAKAETGWLKPTGGILDIGKGAVAGVAQAVAGEIDTIDWLANKIADVIPGLPRQEVIGKIRDAIKPEDLDKDEETLTYTIGNAIGYGVTQFALLYAMVFKPLQAAKIMNAARLKDIPSLATKAGRAAVKAQGILRRAEPAGEAWLKGIRAGKFGPRPGIASRALDRLGNVGLVGPVGLGIHGGITGAKEGERYAEEVARGEGRELTDSEKLRADIDGTIRGGTQGFMMGTVLGLMHNWSQLKRAGGMGTLFGGMSFAEGSDANRTFADFLTGALLGWMPNKPGERWRPWTRQPLERIPSNDPTKAGIDTRLVEDLVEVSQAAQVDPRIARSWALSQGYTEQEAALRVKDMAEIYGGPSGDNIHPYVDPRLGTVFKRNSKKGLSTVEKTWAQIRKKHKSHLEACLELEKWSKNFMQKTVPNATSFEHQLMNNLVHTITKDANGFSPIGTAYILPSTAFKGTHTTSWAGMLYRATNKAINDYDLSTWKAVMADGTEVELAAGPGNRMFVDKESRAFMLSNDGTPLPVRDVKAVVSNETGNVIVQQPTPTTKDILAERRVAEKAKNLQMRLEREAVVTKRAEEAKVAAVERKKVTTEQKAVAKAQEAEIKKRVTLTQEETQWIVRQDGEAVWAGTDRGAAKKAYAQTLQALKEGGVAVPEGETAAAGFGVAVPEREAGAEVGKWEGGEVAAQEMRDQRLEFRKILDKLIPQKQRKVAAKKLGITEEEFINQLERKATAIAEGREEAPKIRAPGVPAGELLGKMYREKGGIRRIGEMVPPTKEVKPKVEKVEEKPEFKKYGPQEPAIEYEKKPTAAGLMAVEKDIDLTQTAGALGMSVEQLSNALSQMRAGPPRGVNPALIPYVMEKFLGFTPEQARMLAENGGLAELILDGPDGKGSRPFTPQDIHIDELGRWKPLSARAEKFFNEFFEALGKQMPDLDWPRFAWLSKIIGEGVTPEKAGRIVEYYTLNDLTHALRMDREYTKMKYHRDIIDNPGISHLPEVERYLFKPAQLFATYKFHNAIFGTHSEIKKTLAGIAKSEGVKLDERQLDTSAGWIEMQNEARGVDSQTGRPVEEMERAALFTRETKRFKKTEPLTVRDVEYYFDESKQKEWGEVADVASELSRVGVLPMEYKDRVDLLKSHVRELEAHLGAFGAKFTNLQERVRLVHEIRRIQDRITEVANDTKLPDEKRELKLKRLNTLLKKIVTDKLPSLRREGVEAGYKARLAKLDERLAELAKPTPPVSEKAWRMHLEKEGIPLSDKEREGRIAKIREERSAIAKEYEIKRAPSEQITKEFQEKLTKLDTTAMTPEERSAAGKKLREQKAEALKALDKEREKISLQEEVRWAPLRGPTYTKGKVAEEGEIATFQRLSRRLSEAYEALERVRYQENPINWEAGERRVINTSDGEPLIISVGTSPIPGVGPLQEAALEASLRRAAKKRYVNDIYQFTSGVSTVLGGQEKVAPGVKMPVAGSMTGEYTLQLAAGTSPEARRIRNEIFEEAAAEAKLTPEQKNAAREYYFRQELDRQIAEKAERLAMSQEDIEVAMDMERGLRETYGMSDLLSEADVGAMAYERGAGTTEVPEAVGPGRLGVTPRGTTWQWLRERGLTAEQRKAAKSTDDILAADRKWNAEQADIKRNEELGISQITYPSGKLEHPKAAGAKEMTNTRARLSLEPVVNVETGKVEPGRFEITVFQEALTQTEMNTKKEGIRQLKEDKKIASRKSSFYPLDEAVSKFPWLEREELRKGAPRKAWRRISGVQERVELVEGKKGEKLPSGKAEIFYVEPTYPTREFEPGYVVSDRHVIDHDIRRLQSEVAGAGIMTARGELPVIFSGMLTYTEASAGKGKPNKLVWRFSWERADGEILKPGDPRELQLVRNAELVIKDYLSKRAPMPHEGDVREANIPYEFVETEQPTILEGRKRALERNRREYKGKYGVEYTGKPITEKVWVMSDTFDSRGNLVRKGYTDTSKLSPVELKAERKLAARIEADIMKEKTIEGKYLTSAFEKKLYEASGRIYEPLEVQAGIFKPGRKAEPGKTVAELKYKRAPVQTIRDITIGTKMIQPATIQTGWIAGPRIESPAVAAERIRKEFKKVAEETTKPEARVEIPAERLNNYRTEFQVELDKVPVDIKQALEAYQVELGKSDMLEMLSIPPVVYGYKGMAAGKPEKLAQARKLMSIQLGRRLSTIQNVELIQQRLDGLVRVYDSEMHVFKTGEPTEREAAGAMTVNSNIEIQRLMELIRNKRYAPEAKGVEGIPIEHARNWLKAYDEASLRFKEKLNAERFGIKDGKLVDLEKAEGADVGAIGPGDALSRTTEFAGVEGVPGEHKFYRKPPKGGIRAEMAKMRKIAAIKGKKIILPGASSQEIENALKQGARMSKEAEQDPSMRLKQKEAEFKIASESSRESPPIRVADADKDRVAKKIFVQPLTQSEILQEIKLMEDAKRSPFYLNEEDRIKLYNRNPVRTNSFLRRIFEHFGQFSQSSIPEQRLLAQGADRERMAAIDFRKQMIHNPESPIARIEALASKIRGVKSADEGLELTMDFAMRKKNPSDLPTDPAMREIIQIARNDLAKGVAEAHHMVDVGIDIKQYDCPLVIDMNQTFSKIKGRYGNFEHNDLHKVQGGDTIQAVTTPGEWADIKHILNTKDYWQQSKTTPFASSKILSNMERDALKRHVLQWTSALDDMHHMPGEKKSELRLKDSFNKHLQHRSSKVDILSYKHNFLDAWKSYLYDISKVNYINNVKKLAGPLLNVYPERDVPWTPGWEMERYIKRLFGTWDSQEKWLAKKTENFNTTVGREVFNPAAVAKEFPAFLQKRTVHGAIGMVDSSIRQLTDHTKMMVADESWGKTYMKTWVEGFWNLMNHPQHKVLGNYYKYWDALAIGKESFEGTTGHRPSLRERLAQKETIPRKLYTVYDWIGERGLSLFTHMEHFNKGFGLLFNINRMKAKGANWDEAVMVGLHNASSNVANMYVPKPVMQAYQEMLNQNIGYSKEHRSVQLGLNPLWRVSTIFWSYPGDMARFVYQGVRDGWHMGRHGEGWGQFARFVTYLGFQATIAGVLGSTLGIDVGSTFGVGLLPVKVMSVPWEILYNSFKGIDPTQYIGKPQFQEEDRQRALEGVKNALGILFVPQYRWGAQQVKNLTSLSEGFKTQINGRDIMEWSTARALMTFLAAPPIENKETYDLVMEFDELSKKQWAQKKTLVNDGIKAIKNQDYSELWRIRDRATEKGIPLSYSDIYEAFKERRELTTLEKAYKRLPANLKPQFADRIKELKSRAFPGGEVARKIRHERNLWSNLTEEE